jgi:adenosine deaminase
MNSILVTSFGTTWQILPEIIAFVNYPKIKIFQNNQQINTFHKLLDSQKINTIHQLWVICTNDTSTNNAIREFENWKNEYINRHGNDGIPTIKFIKSDFPDLTNQEECNAMTDLIYRTILNAKQQSDKLLLSLTGGRKTMSADLLNAASIWGCNLLFHININKNITFKGEILSWKEIIQNILKKFKINNQKNKN